jgi:hypothetical protein
LREQRSKLPGLRGSETTLDFGATRVWCHTCEIPVAANGKPPNAASRGRLRVPGEGRALFPLAERFALAPGVRPEKRGGAA